MKWWLTLPIIFLAFIQTTIYNFNFLWLFILILALAGQEKEALVFAFVGGILFDLLSLSTLGISSLVLIFCVLLVILYQQKFATKNLIFWLIFFFIGNTFFKLVKGQGWRWEEAAISTLFVLLSFFILSKFGVVSQEEEIKLKV
jgi:rod shape-determining protein MreD